MRRFALHRSLVAPFAFVIALAAATPLGAQSWAPGRQQQQNDGVPPGYRPPPGMCRIWIDGVPPSQQPAPTDCATAVRNRPANGRVIFGDDAAKPGKGKPKKFRGITRADANDDARAEVARRGGRNDDDDDPDDRRRDREHDNNAPAGAIGTGRSFPDMLAGVAALQGRRTDDVARWLDGSQVTARVSDLDGNGTPERVLWFDAAGQLVQVWTDRNRDGRADRVEMFENGRRVQVLGN